MDQQTGEQTDMKADRQTSIQTNKQTCRQIDGRADRQTNRHTGRQIMEEPTGRYTQHTRTGNQVGKPADRRDRQEGK